MVMLSVTIAVTVVTLERTSLVIANTMLGCFPPLLPFCLVDSLTTQSYRPPARELVLVPLVGSRICPLLPLSTLSELFKKRNSHESYFTCDYYCVGRLTFCYSVAYVLGRLLGTEGTVCIMG